MLTAEALFQHLGEISQHQSLMLPHTAMFKGSCTSQPFRETMAMTSDCSLHHLFPKGQRTQAVTSISRSVTIHFPAETQLY